MPKVFKAPALDTSTLGTDFTRGDIELIGVDHAGSSYEGRVFLNNPDADAQTPRAPSTGYAGSYFIFGHGGCLGDVGHCDVVDRDPYDPRPGHPLTRARKVLIASEELRGVLSADKLTVTIVPVILSVGPQPGDDENIVKVDEIRVVTYR